MGVRIGKIHCLAVRAPGEAVRACDVAEHLRDLTVRSESVKCGAADLVLDGSRPKATVLADAAIIEPDGLTRAEHIRHFEYGAGIWIEQAEARPCRGNQPAGCSQAD